MKKVQMRRCHFSLFVLLFFFSLTSFQEQTILKVVETDRRRKKAFQWRETSQRLQTQSSNHFVCSLSQHPDMSPGARWFKVPSYSLKKHTHNKTHIRLFFFSFFMSWRGVKTSVWISFSFFKAVKRTEPLLAALPGTVRGTERSISLSLSVSLSLSLPQPLSPSLSTHTLTYTLLTLLRIHLYRLPSPTELGGVFSVAPSLLHVPACNAGICVSKPRMWAKIICPYLNIQHTKVCYISLCHL